jgi:hypothetical protein
MPFTGDVEHIAKAESIASIMHVNGGIQDAVVVAQRGVWVAFIQPVIDQQRSVVVCSERPTDVKSRVFIHTERGFEPNNHRTFISWLTQIADPSTPLIKMRRERCHS